MCRSKIFQTDDIKYLADSFSKLNDVLEKIKGDDTVHVFLASVVWDGCGGGGV